MSNINRLSKRIDQYVNEVAKDLYKVINPNAAEDAFEKFTDPRYVKLLEIYVHQMVLMPFHEYGYKEISDMHIHKSMHVTHQFTLFKNHKNFNDESKQYRENSYRCCKVALESMSEHLMREDREKEEVVSGSRKKSTGFEWNNAIRKMFGDDS